MKDHLQSRPEMGNGIYTVPDMAAILGIPYKKVLKWINKFWDGRFGNVYDHLYSWSVDQTKAVNFHTLIELYTFYELSQAGVSSKEILQAHQVLSKTNETHYPFANKFILNNIRTDGKKILFEQKDGSIYTIDAAKQFKLGFIRDFSRIWILIMIIWRCASGLWENRSPLSVTLIISLVNLLLRAQIFHQRSYTKCTWQMSRLIL